MRSEWLAIAEKQGQMLTTLATEVAKLNARRETAARSTTHGNDFEAAALRFIGTMRESVRKGRPT